MKKPTHLVDIIIPTWNNYEYAYPGVSSILQNKVTENLFHITLVNNGDIGSCDWAKENPNVTVLDAGENLRWEGGLIKGLENTSAPYVIFHNDDTHILPSSRLWIHKMLQHFKDEKVGAVGPSSNVVMGWQNIFANPPAHIFTSTFLIGFCLMIKRSVLEEAGGVDPSLPGGDDLDLSIRVRQAGYKLIIDREVFVYHHGFKTGTRIHGNPNSPGGWNSPEMTDKTNNALIKKHGFIVWWEMMKGVHQLPSLEWSDKADTEGEIVRNWIKPGTIYDLGCGDNKTVPEAVGIDLIPEGEDIPSLGGAPVSVASIQADVFEKLPIPDGGADTIIARHILEHTYEPIKVLREWKASLKRGGRLIIAVPNQGVHNSLMMNIEHRSAYNPESLKDLLTLAGFEVVAQEDGGNKISFVTVADKK